VVVELPRRPQPALDGGAVALGELIEDVSLFVADAALHRGSGAEHVTDRLA
jgi:hypothetical protein